ncbi:MAG: OmpA family protein, partial [Thermodesulfobacteriota bacterium]
LNDGILTLKVECEVKGVYVDRFDWTDRSAALALVDPFGKIFNSSTGALVDGAIVTIVNVSTGLPAIVYGADGVSEYPATITSGGIATDSSGNVYDFPPGEYRFPVISPGAYRIEVIAPAGYTSPSSVATSVLQMLQGGPFAIVEPGSRGEDFVLNPGPAIHIDIPIDPLSSSLFVSKTASKDNVSIGDFLQYEVGLQNTSLVVMTGITVLDTLPPGFRYRRGSAKVDGLKASDPSISSDGRTLSFGPLTLAPGVTTVVRYVVEVSAGTRAGEAINTAFAAAGGISSNSARATVKVKEEFFRDKAIILGRVSDAPCGEDTADAPGVKGIRIYLEDGTYVITDSNGMYHVEGVDPGAHVVQLDKKTVPEGYEIAQCADNTRFAGNDFSQFAELEGGSMWRADFRIKKLPDPTGEVSVALWSLFDGDTVEYSVPISVKDVPLVNARLMVMLPSGAYYLPGTSALDGEEIADPEEAEGVLIYRLGDIPVGWEEEVRFNAGVVPIEENGDMKTVAVLLFDTTAEKGKMTPPVDNVITRVAVEERNSDAAIVLRPHFPVMSAELGDKAVKTLKPVAEELRALNIVRIFVTGHTDSTPIRPANRKVFVDNRALSKARAASVARYFMDSLGLNPSQVIVDGKGADEPIASNAGESGRALNRRVEVSVESETVKNTVSFEPVRTESAVEIVATKGSRFAKAKPPSDGKASSNIGYADFSVDKESKGFEILWPAEGYYPPIPSVNIAVKHGGNERVSIFLNGEPVSPLNFEDTVKNNDATVAITRWRGVDLKEGDNKFEAALFDETGAEIGRVSRVTHYSGEPVEAVLVTDKSVLVADAKTPVVMAVRLTDNSGKPAREGAIGEFLVVPPHMAKSKAGAIDKAALTAIGKDAAQFTVGEDGVALIELKPTAQSGEAIVKLRLASGEREVRAWVAPEDRDWILVGFAEGTAGYNTVRGNIENMQASDGDEHFYDDGRVAFFAKGKIQGSWLMTAAYDSGKDAYNEGSLHQTIDPGSYYTVYGDSTEQGYDAASSRKLYVKMEKDAFYALFGDYDTGLTVTELGRYNRSFNGLKSEYRSERFGYTAFVADTDKAFQKDEILGDGTSGLYKLSRENIVENSEKVAIETRDRFKSEVVISSRPLARHIDYDIDYGASTIFFKEPIPSKDEFFNPIYIVADYESMDAGDKKYNYGGRAYAKTLGSEAEVGATHVHEGRIGAEGNLYGADATVKVSDAVKVKAEAAYTEKESGSLNRSGTAYVVEAAHDGAKLNAKAYVREQNSEFGLGQQKGSESGMRKMGAEGAYRVDDKISYNGQLYRQSNLSTDAERDLGEARINYREKHYSLYTGLRRVDDRLGDGTVNDSTQLTLGGALRVLDDRLSLSISRDQSIFSDNNSVDFPTRTILGADYKITEKASLFASQEFTDGNDESAEATRLGIKASLWKGGEVNSSLGRSFNENGERIFSNTGVKQSLSLTEKWTLDAGLDNSSTFKHPGNKPFNVNTPPASGGGEDFTAISLGLGYRETNWGWTSRIETRNAETSDKWSFLTGVYGEPDKGLGVSLGLR